ncbi:hypothetical protein CA13_06980 [Planctomycetes bacterium CA13]|uniref:Uncharacterized protein n=1 Tax=Novipirellula herctigrandis TaxID=2527986 RepID=A0A5C5YW55_9BACT|nr:hypothetical protein CA13_06980 [Planctomycetes bacterium CA13]
MLQEPVLQEPVLQEPELQEPELQQPEPQWEDEAYITDDREAMARHEPIDPELNSPESTSAASEFSDIASAHASDELWPTYDQFEQRAVEKNEHGDQPADQLSVGQEPAAELSLEESLIQEVESERATSDQEHQDETPEETKSVWKTSSLPYEPTAQLNDDALETFDDYPTDNQSAWQTPSQLISTERNESDSAEEQSQSNSFGAESQEICQENSDSEPSVEWQQTAELVDLDHITPVEEDDPTADNYRENADPVMSQTFNGFNLEPTPPTNWNQTPDEHDSEPSFTENQESHVHDESSSDRPIESVWEHDADANQSPDSDQELDTCQGTELGSLASQLINDIESSHESDIIHEDSELAANNLSPGDVQDNGSFSEMDTNAGLPSEADDVFEPTEQTYQLDAVDEAEQDHTRQWAFDDSEHEEENSISVNHDVPDAPIPFALDEASAEEPVSVTETAQPVETAALDVHSAGSHSDGEEDEDSIEAYMNRLLKRVQGDTTANSPMPKKTDDSEPSEASDVSEVSNSDSVTNMDESPEPMDPPAPIDLPEPMLPRSQAPERTSNMSAMRELANQSARTAISRSVRIQTRDTQLKAMMKLVYAGVSVFCAMLIVIFLVHWLKYPAAIAIIVLGGVFAREGQLLMKAAKDRLEQAESDLVSQQSSIDENADQPMAQEAATKEVE